MSLRQIQWTIDPFARSAAYIIVIDLRSSQGVPSVALGSTVPGNQRLLPNLQAGGQIIGGVFDLALSVS